MMANYSHDVYRHISGQILAVGSSGGVSASTGGFGTQTYFVRLCAAGAASASAGVRYVIGDTPVATGSSALLPLNWVEIVKCTPGQKLAALSNDSILPSLSIIELTD